MVFILLVLVIGGAFVGGAVLIACGSRAKTGKKRWLTAVGGILLAVGGLGFFGTALSATGGLRWLPPSFEWPVGYASGILVMPDGNHVVPHTAAGRIQVYDTDWRFVRGWCVDAGGGRFKIRLADNDKIEVITARRRMRYVYTVDGCLLSQETYTPETYSSFPASGQSAVVPTQWWLWTFTHPFLSWAVLALGGALVILADRRKAKRKKAA